MMVLSQNHDVSVDMTSADIQVVHPVNDVGQPLQDEIICYQICMDGFVRTFVVAQYVLLDQAKLVFQDINSKLAKGVSFYDISEQEKELFKQKK